MAKNKHFSFLCNRLVINNLHYYLAKHAYLVSKRALARVQKGTFCKSIEHLFAAKRPYIGFEGYEKKLSNIKVNEFTSRQDNQVYT